MVSGKPYISAYKAMMKACTKPAPVQSCQLRGATMVHETDVGRLERLLPHV